MKVAVLGAGGMGGAACQAIASSPLVSDIVVMDINPARAEAFKKRSKVSKVTTDLSEVMNDRDIPLVFVTASNDAHKPLCMAAFEAGKAVMCEKPMANTLADAKEMVEAAERKGLFFQIGFELRYSKLYTAIKDWADQGLLGQVVNTQCSYFYSEFHKKGSWRNKKATGGSMFGEKLSHS